MLDVFDPYSLDEVASCLQRAEREVRQVFAALPPERFVARPTPNAWSPGEHLSHLILSTLAVERALAVPRLVLWLRFGPSGRTSRRYVEVRDVYRAALVAGGRATAGFVPRPFGVADPREVQRATLARWGRAGSSLVVRVREWNEAALDRIRLPHPLLGKLTVREILLFTLYHDRHHLDAVRRRPEAALPSR